MGAAMGMIAVVSTRARLTKRQSSEAGTHAMLARFVSGPCLGPWTGLLDGVSKLPGRAQAVGGIAAPHR